MHKKISITIHKMDIKTYFNSKYSKFKIEFHTEALFL